MLQLYIDLALSRLARHAISLPESRNVLLEAFGVSPPYGAPRGPELAPTARGVGMGPRLNAPSAQFTYFDVHAHTDTRSDGSERCMSLHKEPSASDLRGLICARRRCSARTGTGPARAAPRNALPRPLVDGGPGPRAPLVAVEGKACQTATSRRQVGSRCRQCCRRLPAVSRADGGFSRPRRQGTVQRACQGWTLWGGGWTPVCRLSTHVLMLKVVADAQHSHVPSS